MRIWAFVSQKGGAGKSTLSTQIAVYASQCGEKVIILDMDPQASSNAWHEVRGAGSTPSVIVCLPGKLGPALTAIRDSGAFTLVIIDTPPHSDKTAVEAIKHTDLIVCPTRPSMMDIRALSDTDKLLDLSDTKDRALAVINCIHPAGAAKSYAKTCAGIEAYGIRVAATYICDRVAFVHATDSGKGVTETAAKSEAANEVQRLWAELNGTWPVVVPMEEAHEQH